MEHELLYGEECLHCTDLQLGVRACLGFVQVMSSSLPAASERMHASTKACFDLTDLAAIHQWGVAYVEGKRAAAGDRGRRACQLQQVSMPVFGRPRIVHNGWEMKSDQPCWLVNK